MKSARLEWVLGNLPQARALLAQAVEIHPTSPKVMPCTRGGAARLTVRSCG